MSIYVQIYGILDAMPPSTRQPTPFGMFLLQRIQAAGFGSVSMFAKAAGISAATMGRLIYTTEHLPDARTLERIAAAADIPLPDVMVAYAADRPSPYVKADLSGAHVLGLEVVQMLAQDSPLSDDDRHILETLLDRVISLYRPAMRRD